MLIFITLGHIVIFFLVLLIWCKSLIDCRIVLQNALLLILSCIIIFIWLNIFYWIYRFIQDWVWYHGKSLLLQWYFKPYLLLFFILLQTKLFGAKSYFWIFVVWPTFDLSTWQFFLLFVFLFLFLWLLIVLYKIYAVSGLYYLYRSWKFEYTLLVTWHQLIFLSRFNANINIFEF